MVKAYSSKQNFEGIKIVLAFKVIFAQELEVEAVANTRTQLVIQEKKNLEVTPKSYDKHLCLLESEITTVFKKVEDYS